MVKKIFMIYLLFLYIFAITIYANDLSMYGFQENNTNTSYEYESNHVIDNADIFTDDEENMLESKINDSISQMYEPTDIVIYTELSNSSAEQTSEKYMNNSYNNNFNDVVIITIEMNNRDLNISGYGKCETTINNSVCDMIIDSMINDMRNDRYFDACNSGIDSALYFINSYDYSSLEGKYDEYGNFNEEGVDYSDYYKEKADFNFLNLVIYDIGEFIKATLIFLIVCAIVIKILLITYKNFFILKDTTTSSTYLENNEFDVLQKQDIFLRKTVSKTKKSSSSSSGGGGGRRHSSSSRRF